MVTVDRIRSWHRCGPIVSMIASTTDLPFTPNQFLHWAMQAAENPNVYLLLLSLNLEPAGFMSVFGPTDIEHTFFIHWAYLRPEFRGLASPVLRAGINYLNQLKDDFGVKAIGFVTPHPRAWARLFGRTPKKVSSYVEI